MRKAVQISSLDIPELAPYCGLKEAQLLHYYEPEPGLFIAESALVIERALAAGYCPVSVLCEDSFIETSEQITEKYPQTPVYAGPKTVLEQITGYALTRGMLCAMRRKQPADAEELLGKLGASSTVAVLEEVVNPTNVGAIFRSAAALGIDAVLLTAGCADPLQRRCVRVSMGTVFQVPWTYLGDEWLSFLHEKGYFTAAMALRGDVRPVNDPALAGKSRLAVILGTEGEGLKQSTIDGCDCAVRIPMQHGVDSLNVAAASAVAFWELKGRRSDPGA